MACLRGEVSWTGYLCPRFSGSYTEALAPSSVVNGIGPLVHKTSDFPCGSADRESACSGGDLGSIPGLGRSPGGEKGYPLQDSGLENSMDCIVHMVATGRTRLSNFHFQTRPQFARPFPSGGHSTAVYEPRRGPCRPQLCRSRDPGRPASRTERNNVPLSESLCV